VIDEPSSCHGHQPGSRDLLASPLGEPTGRLYEHFTRDVFGNLGRAAARKQESMNGVQLRIEKAAQLLRSAVDGGIRSCSQWLHTLRPHTASSQPGQRICRVDSPVPIGGYGGTMLQPLWRSLRTGHRYLAPAVGTVEQVVLRACIDSG
jgi:hypothetical protein